MGFVYATDDMADSLFGKAVPCSTCTDYLPISGLKPHEQQLQISDIRKSEPVHTVLRVLARQMLADPFGWISVYGQEHPETGTVTGSAKSLFAQILVAEFCRQRVRALYKHAGDVSQMLYQDLEDSQSANEMLLRRCRVLAIDEMQDINPTEWLVGKFKALLDHRYRSADQGMVTVLVWQRHPEEYGWVPESWLSRMADGRFNRPWPQDVSVPDCDAIVKTGGGAYISGLLPVTAPDVRPYRVRTIEQDPAGKYL